MIALTRRYAFPAAHVLRSPALTDDENARVYGKCANPGGHGHDYGLEVSVSGPVDARSGLIVDRAALDAIVEERVLDRFGYRMLNEDPAFGARVPTAENIAAQIHAILAGPIAELGSVRLVRVRLHETRKNSFAYGESR
jgi:6-pyruvoyltetrahydropterin/6-carboxytetrahydropterin synthase